MNHKKFPAYQTDAEESEVSQVSLIPSVNHVPLFEIACATVLIVGVIYFIRFLIYFRENMVELYFRIFLGAIILFTAGWSVYIFIKLYEHYRLFKKAGKDKNDFEET